MLPLRTILPINRWNVLVLIGASVLLLAILGIDYVTTWTMLLFYLAPVIAVATLARGHWWVVMALVTTVLWYVVRYLSPGPDAFINGVREPWTQALWIFVTARFMPLVLVGFLCARLRHYSRTPESLNSAYDPTGLLSAGGLREILARRAITERLNEGPVSLLLLDVERRVSAYAGQSSEYGALVGAMISKVLMSNARASDLCARLSPNHFLVIMPGTDQNAATKVNNAILEALPEIAHALGDSVSISSLLLHSESSATNLNLMRSYAQNRLITLKVMGLGKNHTEVWTRGATAARIGQS
jgi:GGDEF domain-containing protein